MQPPSAIQGGASVQQGLSAAYESLAFCKHRRAADKRYSLSRMNNRAALLNDFATRSFRDTADQDYIAARLAFRSRLIPQFLWLSLQALEKYLKCVLVLNRIKANHGHDLGKILKKFELAKPFELRLSEPCKKFLNFLDTYARHRYFESSWYVRGGELIEIDRAVWEIRRYARVMRYEVHGAGRTLVDALPWVFRFIVTAHSGIVTRDSGDRDRG